MAIRNNLDYSLNNNNKVPSLKVFLKRGSCIESTHKVHAVITDIKGRVLMQCGNPKLETFIRSALKPFQAITYLSSGAYENISCGDSSIAIACGSHAGQAKHAREAFKILWSSDIDVSHLQCPIPRDKKSRLEHNCSGKHSAFLATCKKMNWSLDNYLEKSHPLQKEINRRIAQMLNLPADELFSARDDCGAPTLKLDISQMALLYAHLSGSDNAELEQINRSMSKNPDLVAGEGKFDTELIKRAHGQLISKSGAEGVQCIGRTGEGIGLAIKVEDGSKRAKTAAALHLIKQLEWLTPGSLDELEKIFMSINPDVNLQVEGELKFHEN